MIRTAALVGVLALAGAAHAQTTSFSLVDGNFRYNERSLTSGASTGTADFGLNTGSTTSVGSDYLFQNWWWMRVGNATAEQELRSTEQTSFSLLSNNSAFLSYVRPGPTGQGGIQVNLTYTLNQITATQAALTINWNLTNLNNEETAVSWFNYTDWDVITATDLYSFVSVPGFMQVRADNASPGADGEFATLSADLRVPTAWQVGPFSGTGSPRTSLTDAAITNLNSMFNGANPGDQAAAFQWDLLIAAGGTVGGRVTKGYNYDPIPAPGALALLGLGGLVATRRRRA
jgi:MYXO-CTERM domain-containing protein